MHGPVRKQEGQLATVPWPRVHVLTLAISAKHVGVVPWDREYECNLEQST